MEAELKVDIALITSNTYWFLFEVKKRTGDKAFRKSNKRFKYVTSKKGKITFTFNDLSNLAQDY